MPQTGDPGDLIPLTPRGFHILVSIADAPLNGYEIMTAVEENSAGAVRVSPGTLYEALHRMNGQGLIEEVSQGLGSRKDGRRQRFYQLTAFGRRVLEVETARLAHDLRLARGSGFAGGVL